MKDMLKALGLRIRKLRAERGLTQEVFAELCGLNRTVLSFVETGQRPADLTTLVTISLGFGMPLADLLRGVDAESHDDQSGRRTAIRS